MDRDLPLGALLPFTICSLLSAAANTVLLIHWSRTLQTRSCGCLFVRRLTLLRVASHVLCGVSLALLSLDRALPSSALCDVSGYGTLFGSQLSLWLTAGCSLANFFCRHRRKFSRRLRHQSGFILNLVVSGFALLAALTSAVPFSGWLSRSNSLFECVAMRTPEQTGWPLWALLLVLGWCAALTTVATVFASLLSGRSRRRRSFSGDGASRKHQNIITSEHAISGGLWIVVLVLLSVLVAVDSPPRQLVWPISWSFLLQLIGAPVIVALSRRRASILERLFGKTESLLDDLIKATPSELTSLERLRGFSKSTSGVEMFVVAWRDRSGSDQRGVMKVYPAYAAARWRQEVEAVAQLGAHSHANVVRCNWINHSIPKAFAPTDGHHFRLQQLSLVCLSGWPSCTLADFLRRRPASLCESGLHSITRDIANGLDFIHSCRIVHNRLSKYTVYLSNVSSARATAPSAQIGDFEQSSVVPELQRCGRNESRTWLDSADLFTISRQLSEQASRCEDVRQFASDIRAFGLLVLDMLVAMSERRDPSGALPLSTCGSGVTRPPWPVIRSESVTDVSDDDLAIRVRDSRARRSSSQILTNGSLVSSPRNTPVSLTEELIPPAVNCVRKRSFTTILEEEEASFPGTTDAMTNTAGNRRSLSSLDGSLLSGDSGLASSNYDVLLPSEASSHTVLNQPGSRGAIYSGSTEPDSFSIYQSVLTSSRSGRSLFHEDVGATQRDRPIAAIETTGFHKIELSENDLLGYSATQDVVYEEIASIKSSRGKPQMQDRVLEKRWRRLVDVATNTSPNESLEQLSLSALDERKHEHLAKFDGLDRAKFPCENVAVHGRPVSTSSPKVVGRRHSAEPFPTARNVYPSQVGGCGDEESGEMLTKAVEQLKGQKDLGIVRQLLPVLNDCWRDTDTPTAENILEKLSELLPTATV